MVRVTPHIKAPVVIKTTWIASAGSKAKAISDLVKTELPLAAGICVVAGEILALGSLPTIVEALLAFLTGFFISGSAMISNDYFDLDVDRINHPERPLPSGRITILELMVLTCIFSFGGFVTAALLGTLALTLAVVIWVVGILYNWKYKETGLFGNMMVSLSVAMTFIFGGVSVGGLANGVVWTFGALAFTFDLGEEIAGGVMDVKGDEQRSAQSLARVRGKEYALRVSCLLFASFVGLSFLPFVIGWLGIIYLVLLIPANLAVVYFVFRLLRHGTVEEGRTRIRQLYLTMVFFVIAFIASSFF